MWPSGICRGVEEQNKSFYVGKRCSLFVLPVRSNGVSNRAKAEAWVSCLWICLWLVGGNCLLSRHVHVRLALASLLVIRSSNLRVSFICSIVDVMLQEVQNLIYPLCWPRTGIRRIFTDVYFNCWTMYVFFFVQKKEMCDKRLLYLHATL